MRISIRQFYFGKNLGSVAAGMMKCVMMQVLPGGHGARTYQDERFSYVVLRRGARPTSHTIPDLTIARQRQIDPPDAVQQAIEAGDIPLTGPQKLC